ESELRLRLADATNTAGRRRDAERSHHQRGLVETAVAETRTVERHREHGDIAGGGDERIDEASHDGCEALRAAVLQRADHVAGGAFVVDGGDRTIERVPTETSRAVVWPGPMSAAVWAAG